MKKITCALCGDAKRIDQITVSIAKLKGSTISVCDDCTEMLSDLLATRKALKRK